MLEQHHSFGPYQSIRWVFRYTRVIWDHWQCKEWFLFENKGIFINQKGQTFSAKSEWPECTSAPIWLIGCFGFFQGWTWGWGYLLRFFSFEGFSMSGFLYINVLFSFTLEKNMDLSKKLLKNAGRNLRNVWRRYYCVHSLHKIWKVSSCHFTRGSRWKLTTTDSVQDMSSTDPWRSEEC